MADLPPVPAPPPSPPPPGVLHGLPVPGGPCERCGRTPTATLTFTQRTGMVVTAREERVSATLCRDCAQGIGRRMQDRTLLLGWWGFSSFFLNLATVPRNAMALRRAARLADPQGDPTAALTPGRPVLGRLGAPLVTVAVLAIAAAVALDDSAPIEVGSCVRTDGRSVDGVECGSSHDGLIVARVGDPTDCDPTTEWFVEVARRSGEIEAYYCVEDDVHPEAWGSEVAALVPAVEAAFGATFDHPVEVVTLPRLQFLDQLRSNGTGVVDDPEAALPGDDRLDLPRWWRALGLVSGDLDDLPDQVAVDDDLTGAEFDPVDETIYVRADLDPDQVEGVLAHELAHALQHQTTGLNGWPEEEAGARAFQMLVEGDARRIERLVAPLPEVDDDDDGDAQELPGSIPAFVVLEQLAPYELGASSAVLRAATSGGTAAWYATPPATTHAMLDAVAMAEPRSPVELEDVTLDDADEVVERGILDPLLLWELVAGQLPDDEALSMVRDWRGGAWTAVQARQGYCVVVQVAVDEGRAGALHDHLVAWAATLPDAEVVDDGGSDVVWACDPGPHGPDARDDARLDAFWVPAVELEAIATLVEPDEVLDPDRAACLSDVVRTTLTQDERRGLVPTEEDRRAVLRDEAARCER